MPNYLFRNPNTDEVKEVFMRMNDKHVYFENGVEWERVFTVPQASIDTKIDPFSKNKFIEKTYKKGTVGELWDRSEELSRQRAAKRDGVDPLRKKVLEDYKKQRHGKIHPLEQKEKREKTIEI